eukprot:753644-Hanusia_phi.AAC.4
MDPLFPGVFSKSTVCSGNGTCTTSKGCVCSFGAGVNCSLPARCPQGCNGHGRCVGLNGLANDQGSCICDNYPDKFPTDYSIFLTPKYIGKSCETLVCPGYDVNTKTQCSGHGTCDSSTRCFCSTYGVNQKTYLDADCGSLNNEYIVDSISPAVGPLQGDTIVTMRGIGIDRAIKKSGPVYCDFKVGKLTIATYGNYRDMVLCTSPPALIQTTIIIDLVDSQRVLIKGYTNNFQFEYYVEPSIIQLIPTFVPLRPRVPNQNYTKMYFGNIITVVGSYFPKNGIYQVKFEDCTSQPGSYLSETSIEIYVPQLPSGGKYVLQVTANGQQYSPTSQSFPMLTVYEITKVFPPCVSTQGTNVVTVIGKYLVDHSDPTRVNAHPYCQFGTISYQGQTVAYGSRKTDPNFRYFAFQSRAYESFSVPGALECNAPDAAVMDNSFSLTLNATKFIPPKLDPFYLGQYDYTPSIQVNTFYLPILKAPPWAIIPSIGPINGGTVITVTGWGFDYSKYNPISGAFIQGVPRYDRTPYCNPFPIPQCSFGSMKTSKLTILSDNSLTCVSPRVTDMLRTAQPYAFGVGLDGQSFTTAKIRFKYFPHLQIDRVLPSSGPVNGGTQLTVYGQGFVDPGSLEKLWFLYCVFTRGFPKTRYHTVAYYVNTSAVTCSSPFNLSAPGDLTVDISLNREFEDDQLSGSSVTFVVYFNPFIKVLQNSFSSIKGNQVITVIGGNFRNYSTISCRFGSQSNVVRATFATSSQIFCLSPPLNSPMAASFQVSLNDNDFSSNAVRFYFYSFGSVFPPEVYLRRETRLTLSIKFDSSNETKKELTILASQNYFIFLLNFDSEMSALSAQDVRFDSSTSSLIGSFYVSQDDWCTNYISSCFPGKVTVFFSITPVPTFVNSDVFNFTFTSLIIQSVIPPNFTKSVILLKNGLSYSITFVYSGASFFSSNLSCYFLPCNQTCPENNSSNNVRSSYRVAAQIDRSSLQISCIAPSVNASSSITSYLSTVGNLYSVSNQWFRIQYVSPPKIKLTTLAIFSTTAHISFPIEWHNATQTGQMRFSCVFFSIASQALKFTFATYDIQNSSLTCDLPSIATPQIWDPIYGVDKYILAVSLNERDPCIDCAILSAKQVFISNVQSGANRFGFNPQMNSYCGSNPKDFYSAFCDESPNGDFASLYIVQRPSNIYVSPPAMLLQGQESSNTNISLSGQNLKYLNWKNWPTSWPWNSNCTRFPSLGMDVSCKVSYLGTTKLLLGYFDFCTLKLEINLSLVERDIISQNVTEASVQFQLNLLNDSDYYHVERYLMIYTVPVCPQINGLTCGYGMCIDSECKCYNNSFKTSSVDIGCFVSPTIDSISPSLAPASVKTRGTQVIVNMTLWQTTSFSTASNPWNVYENWPFVCIFGNQSRYTSAKLIGGLNSDSIQRRFSCPVPPFDFTPGTITLSIAPTTWYHDTILHSFGSKSFQFYLQPTILFGTVNISNPNLTFPTCSSTLQQECTSEVFSIHVFGYNFSDFSQATCKFESNSSSNIQFIPMEYISSSQVICSLPSMTLSGKYTLSISMNGQEYASKTLSVSFYEQPFVFMGDSSNLGGLIVNQDNSIDQLKRLYGTNVSKISSISLKSRVTAAPNGGGTPLTLFLSTDCSKCEGNLKWFQRDMKLRFVPCPSKTSMCSCFSGNYYDVDTLSLGMVNQTYAELHLLTPYIRNSDVGNFRVCFALDGMHFLPLQNCSVLSPDCFGQYIDFQFYPPPIITGVAGHYYPIDLPSHIQVQVNVTLYGSNFFHDYLSNENLVVILGNSHQVLTQINPTDITFNQPGEYIQFPLPPLNVSLNLTVNITISLDGYDYPILNSRLAEIFIYKYPTLDMMVPRFGPTNFATNITIHGSYFNKMPQMMCKFSSLCSDNSCSCSNQQVYKYSNAYFKSDNIIICPQAYVVDKTSGKVLNSTCVSFTPDASDLLLQSPKNSIFRMVSPYLPLNISASALPIKGSNFSLAMRQKFTSKSTASENCFVKELSKGTEFQLSLNPNLPEYVSTPSITFDWEFSSSVYPSTGYNPGMWSCVTYISVHNISLPFPMKVGVEFSFNGNQSKDRQLMEILFYSNVAPKDFYILPLRASLQNLPRPDVDFTILVNLLAGIKQSLSTNLVHAMFTSAPDCDPSKIYFCKNGQNLSQGEGGCDPSKIYICPVGPSCVFAYKAYNNSAVVSGALLIDKYYYIRCQAPNVSSDRYANLSILMHGSWMIQNLGPFHFFKQPQVQNAYPSAVSFDVKTNLFVNGSFFLPNNNKQTQLFCVFDFNNNTPASNNWLTLRRFSNATYWNSTALTCDSPAIPGGRTTNPIYPVARVGVILDGICFPSTDNCQTIENLDQPLWTNAFIIYIPTPQISRINPANGFPISPLGREILITVYGVNLFRYYTIGTLTGQPFSQLQVEFRRIDPQSRYNATVNFGWTCRFNHTVTNISDANPTALTCGLAGANPAPCSFFVCSIPRANYTEVTEVPFSISFNGFAEQYSKEVTFTYAAPRVYKVSPSLGDVKGGYLITVEGAQVLNTSNLTCKFSQCVYDSSGFCRPVENTFKPVSLSGSFLNSTKVVCPAPDGHNWNMTHTGDCNLPPNDPNGLCYGLLNLQISNNALEFSNISVASMFQYNTYVGFNSFLPKSGPRSGGTNINISGFNFDTVKNISCKFGSQTPVQALILDDATIICKTPNFTETIPYGGVSLGFSTNGISFCYLFPIPGTSTLVCNYSTSLTKSVKFLFHDDYNLHSIFPASGDYAGKTVINITGAGFTNYSQPIYCIFDITSNSIPAVIVSSTRVRCQSAPMPTNSKAYFLDNGYPLYLSSNFIDMSKPIKFTWIATPQITSISPVSSGLYSSLSATFYSPLQQMVGINSNLPEGGVNGNTIITVVGVNLTSLGRPVLRDNVRCQFPFTIPRSSPPQYAYACTTTNSIQKGKSPYCVGPNDQEYPCYFTNSTWYNTDNQKIADLKCRFGEILTQASVLDRNTILCAAPAQPTGTIVPVSVTLNDIEYSNLRSNTYFQYMSPRPNVLKSQLSNDGSLINIKFSEPTNLFGNPSFYQNHFPCSDVFESNTVRSFGTSSSCTWDALNQTMTVFVGTKAYFQLNDELVFLSSLENLLINPFPLVGCQYFTVSLICKQKESVSLDANTKPWCGSCLPLSTISALQMTAIPFIQVSYPLNLSDSSYSVFIGAPTSPSRPIPKINGPDVTSGCSKFCIGGVNDGMQCSKSSDCVDSECKLTLAKLDATASTGAIKREFAVISWGLQSGSVKLSNETIISDVKIDFRSLDGNLTVYVTSDLLPYQNIISAEFCFSLYLENWIQGNGITQNCKPVYFINLSIPIFNLNRPASNTQSIAQGFSISVTGSFGSCPVPDSLSYINYTWSITPTSNLMGLDLITTTDSVYEIPPFSVVPHQIQSSLTYTVAISIVVQVQKVIVLPFAVQLTFIRSAPVAILLGGNKSIGYKDTFVLNGSSSYDPDLSANNTDLVYCWMYSPEGGSIVIPENNVSVWTVDKELQMSTLYTFTLTVYRKQSELFNCSEAVSRGYMSSSASVNISVASISHVPILQIQPLSSYIFSVRENNRISALLKQQNCQMSKPSSCILLYQWSVRPYVPFPFNLETGYGIVSLIFPPQTFSTVFSITYTISISTVFDSQTIASSVQVQSNVGPRGGNLVVLPSRGVAFQTTFTLVATAWDAEYLPLQYSFSYVCYNAGLTLSIDMAGFQDSNSLSNLLPTQNLQMDYRMNLVLIVRDSVGALGQASSGVWLEKPSSTDSIITSFEKQMSERLLFKDIYGASLQLANYGMLVSSVCSSANLLCETLIAKLAAAAFSLLGYSPLPSSARRLLSIKQTQALSSLDTVLNSFSFLTVGSPSYLNASICKTSINILKNTLASQLTIGTSQNSKRSRAERLLYMVANCQEYLTTGTFWDDMLSVLEYVGVLIMKGAVEGDLEMFDVNNQTNPHRLTVIYARYSTTYVQTQLLNLTLGNQVLLTLNIPTLNNNATFSTFDLHAVILGSSMSYGDSALYSRLVELVALEPLSDTDTTLPADVSNITLNFSGPVSMQVFNMYTLCTNSRGCNRDPSNGVSTGVVCGYYNESLQRWVQYGGNYRVYPGAISCPGNNSLHRFYSLITGTIGCDLIASVNPQVLNPCLSCSLTQIPRQGICDYKGRVCYGKMDKCYVCNGHNKSFTSPALTNESGVCNYLGQVCPDGQVVTVCGVCGAPSNEKSTVPDTGVCDHCGVPNGNNRTMDSCGVNPAIPTQYVCHPNGKVAAGSSWNAACTGCDGVVRPDLAWNSVTGGGVKRDECGVCGGNGSSCAGCDGLPNSGKVYDICGICGGTGSYCKGCNGIPSRHPTQFDNCRICGGNFFGACNANPLQRCNTNTFLPQSVCRQGCDGVENSGKTYNKCGKCGARDSACILCNSTQTKTGSCLSIYTWTNVTKCYFGTYVDKCGKCGGNSTTCQGCDGVPFSGKVLDICGVCDGLGTSCMGCDGVANSGKVLDSCGVCDGSNARDSCGVCLNKLVGLPNESCTGCDGSLFSGKSVDACGVCGGSNLCKWRDGQLPPNDPTGLAVNVTVIVQ